MINPHIHVWTLTMDSQYVDDMVTNIHRSLDKNMVTFQDVWMLWLIENKKVKYVHHMTKNGEIIHEWVDNKDQ